MDRLLSMTVFVRVAEAKSFAAAARTLDLSPTMVANHVRALESQLRARLVERTTRRHTLTDIGVGYLERCRDVLESVAAADGIVEAARIKPEGLLRVTAPVSYGAHCLAPALAEYSQSFPGVQIELDLTDRVVNLEEEGFHAGIRAGTGSNERLHTVPLRPSAMWAVASPDYLLRRGRPRHPADLARHACLSFKVWGPGHAWRFTRDGETVAVQAKGPLIINNGQALLQAALSGAGVVVQPDVLLRAAVERGDLVRVLPRWDLATRPLQLIHPRRAPPSAKLRSFVEFVSQRLG